jgi:hypothetical protein
MSALCAGPNELKREWELAKDCDDLEETFVTSDALCCICAV